MIDFTRRLKETPVFFIPICETFHFKEWKPINLQEKTLTSKIANLSKPHLRQGAGSVKVQVVCDQPYKLLKIDVLGYFSSRNLLAGMSLIWWQRYVRRFQVLEWGGKSPASKSFHTLVESPPRCRLGAPRQIRTTFYLSRTARLVTLSLSHSRRKLLSFWILSKFPPFPFWKTCTTFFNAKNVDLSDTQNDSLSKILLKQDHLRLNVAPDLSNHHQSIDLFRSMIIKKNR